MISQEVSKITQITQILLIEQDDILFYWKMERGLTPASADLVEFGLVMLIFIQRSALQRRSFPLNTISHGDLFVYECHVDQIIIICVICVIC